MKASSVFEIAFYAERKGTFGGLLYEPLARFRSQGLSRYPRGEAALGTVFV